MIGRAKRWARAIKRDIHALYLAARDPRTPWYAKAVAVVVAAYALSPIDLIPDFIPIIGYLDDLILVPLGVLIAVRMIPPGIMDQHRLTAAAAERRPVSKVAAALFILIWIAAAVLSGLAIKHYISS